MITIMLAGKARVGKTTAANLIQSFAKKNDFKPVILPFAKTIKDEAESLGLSKDSDPAKYRAFCQELGEGKRKENPDYWINLFKDKWMELDALDTAASQDPDKLWKETVVIVDDCRYQNELNFGKLIGAKLVFISHGIRELNDHNGEWRQHESERLANEVESGNKDLIDMFDFRITNGGTLETFTEKLKERVELLLNLRPQGIVPCDCLACKKMRSDEQMSIDDFFNELLGGEDDGA